MVDWVLGSLGLERPQFSSLEMGLRKPDSKGPLLSFDCRVPVLSPKESIGRLTISLQLSTDSSSSNRGIF